MRCGWLLYGRPEKPSIVGREPNHRTRNISSEFEAGGPRRKPIPRTQPLEHWPFAMDSQVFCICGNVVESVACTYGVRALNWDWGVERIAGGERDKVLDLRKCKHRFPED